MLRNNTLFTSLLLSQGPSLEEAKKILLMCLTHMKTDWKFNIVVFGSSKYSIREENKTSLLSKHFTGRHVDLLQILIRRDDILSAGMVQSLK